MGNEGAMETQGLQWLIEGQYVGQEEAERAYGDMKRLHRMNDQLQTAQMQTSRVMKMFAMTVASSAISLIRMSGATKEQTRELEMMVTVLQVVLGLMTAIEMVSMFSGVGATRGAAGFASRASLGMFHQGGYGTDRMAVIRSDERVVPAHQVFNNGSSITVQHLHISGGGEPRETARRFTEELEGLKTSGARTPTWR